MNDVEITTRAMALLRAIDETAANKLLTEQHGIAHPQELVRMTAKQRAAIRHDLMHLWMQIEE